MNDLYYFAKTELEKSAHSSEDAQSVLNLVEQFTSDKYSGTSETECLNAFNRLVKFLPLSPLTGEADEWEELHIGLEQNRRCPQVFKEDGVAFDNIGFVFKSRASGTTYAKDESRKQIAFPYTVPDEPIVLWEDTKEPVEPVEGMSFNNYQICARTTADYPGTGELMGLLYTALGMAGEAGETADQVKKVLRDDNCQVTVERRNKLLNEVGDTLWYVANLAHELGFTLEDVAAYNLKKLADRKARNVIHGDGGKR